MAVVELDERGVLRRKSRCDVSEILTRTTCACGGRRRHAEAERQFRRIIGYADLSKLITAIERDLTQHHPTDTITHRPRRPISSPPPDHHTGTAVAKFHDERDILRLDAGWGDGAAWRYRS